MVQSRNRVLNSLPPRIGEIVYHACERVELKSRAELTQIGARADAVYFPETAVISTLATYNDGSIIEMANIGCEACTGVNLVLGNPKELSTNEVQLPGAALKMPVEDFQSLRASVPEFQTALFSTVQAIFYQVMVSGACNGAHDARQRLARWLLTMDDRNDIEVMHMTHQFLSDMLGVRRATVSEVASGFQADGLIDYKRGQIRITDRPGLIRASCECYDMVHNAYATFLARWGE